MPRPMTDKQTLMRSKNYATLIACRYVQHCMKVGGRAMAEQLDLHFTTWLRYTRGERRPQARVKEKLAALMGVEDFADLVRLGIRTEHKLLKS